MALSLICKQGFRVSKAGSVFRRWVGVAPCKGWPAKPHINAEEIGQEDDSESLACGDERLCNPFDKTDKPEKPTSSYTSPLSGRESVPALEVPLSNLPFQDDEMLSWLQYPLEDSFDRNYCSEELFTGSPISHSNPVQDAFSHLTLKEGKNPQSVGLRSQTFTPSDTITGERNLAADVAMVVDAQRAAGLLTPPVTNTGERALAANAAMAMGARRAAGLLSQSGAEAFNRVRTNAQPYISKRSHTVLPTQEGALTQFNIPSHALTAMDTKSAFKSPSQCLTKPNFPLFSRAVAATKTSVQVVRTCSNTEGVRQPVNTHGKDVLSAGADSTATAMTTSLDSPTLQCHVTSMTAEKSSEPFHAHVKKGWCISTAQSNANAMTGMGSSRLQPYHDGITRRPLIAHLKEGLSSSVTASTTTSVTGMGSCKLQADGSGPTDIESARQPNMAQVKGGLSSCASESNAATGPGTGCKLLADLSSMTNNETGTQLFLSQEGLPSESAATVTTDRDPYMHLELTRHGRETSQGITNPGRSLPPMPPYGKVPIAGKELELGTCPVTASWALTPSEKLCETLETGDVTMASPSRGSGNSTEKSTKEAAPCSTKRKTGPAEDSESESKEFENGKPASGRSSGAKRTRAAEIHNLSERKRRDKINVKIKALQDLIPNANKTDKASILDEAIEYMKMLQSQVQFMSMRTGMVVPPMLLPPGMQSPPMQQRLLSPNMNMGLGTSMGFGMGMGMGMGMLDATSASWRGVMSMPPALGQPLSASAYNAAFCQLGSSYPVILEEQGHMQIHGNTLLPVQQQQQQPLHLNMPMNADMYVAFRQQQQQQHTQEIPSSNAMQ